ncbi:hypothetical protein F5887DRAFT_1077979 [Amanita rubescens]|nr:hypothetical protein F5887DRAFT_1077979 [Amanita rubescens]
MVYCAGCRRNFKPSGFSLHIQRSKNTLCLAAHYNRLKELEQEEHDEVMEEEHDTNDVLQFEGDFFGDYEDDDLDWPDEDCGSPCAEGSDEYEDLEEDEVDPEDDTAEGEVAQDSTHVDVTEQPPRPAVATSLDATDAHQGGGIYVEKFILNSAGSPIQSQEPFNTDYNIYQQRLSQPTSGGDNYYPFTSKINWVIAHWAKIHRIGVSALDELLNEVAEDLGLSYKNSRELHKIIDTQLPGRPKFQRDEISILGESVTLYSRNVVECIKALYGDAEFASHLVFSPERHYTARDKSQRIYHELHTGEWWWEAQIILEQDKRGATIIPVIISSDRTQVTQFGSKSAYPVYLTIGNLPKHIRRKPSHRGQILLAYLPTSKLKHIPNLASRRRCLANLIHSCLQHILSPLEKLGLQGKIMRSGDGVLRRVHPILAVYIGDYPEQLLVAGVKSGECPKCMIDSKELGSITTPLQNRNIIAVLNAFEKADSDPCQFLTACEAEKIKPLYHPFWQRLPLVNIFQSLTPDVLHQLHQGVVKHLMTWLKAAYGVAEIDARFQRVPPNHHIRIFKNGISSLSRLTGKEHDQICRLLMGIVVDMHLPGNLDPSRLIRAVRAIMDFLYLAQLPIHSNGSLRALATSLQEFHDNKDILVELGIREQFNIPKLHMCRHYTSSIQLFGTTDNYNSQNTERLHCDLAKGAYRTTNRKDELPQMTTWLERQDKVHRHANFIQRHDANSKMSRTPAPQTQLGLRRKRRLKMTCRPSARGISLDALTSSYGATYFRDAMARFVAQWRNPQLSRTQIEQEACNISMPFVYVSAYHRIKFTEEDNSVIDAIHVQPSRKDKRGQAIPARFDTVLVRINEAEGNTVHTHRVAQVRVVFTIPEAASKLLFGPTVAPSYLAYVEWFTEFRTHPEPNHGMYKVSHARRGPSRVASIICVTKISQSIHLFPLVGHTISRDLSSDTVLEEVDYFLVNPFNVSDTYVLFNSAVI